MFKNDKREMDIEYKVFKKGFETQGGITDSDVFVHYLIKLQKSTGILKKMGLFLMIIGVPLLIVGIGFLLLPGGFVMRKFGQKLVDKYKYFEELAKVDPDLNHAT